MANSQTASTLAFSIKRLLPTHWRTITALIAMAAATYLQLQSIWGLVFLWWITPAILSGQLAFVEVITRRNEPVLFWLLSAFWVITSISLVVYDIYYYVIL